MTSLLHTTARDIGDTKEAYTQSDSPGGITDLLPRRIHKLTHQGQHGTGGGVRYLKKVKFSHTRYPALGPELIPVYRQSARR